MVVLPLKPSFEELRLTVSSAEMVLPGLNLDEEIVFACEISSLPNHNCNVIFRTAKVRSEVPGYMRFQANRPLVLADHTLNSSDFEKLKRMCSNGEPVRPISLYLKIEKSREIHNGEVLISTKDFVLNIVDVSWRHPLF